MTPRQPSSPAPVNPGELALPVRRSKPWLANLVTNPRSPASRSSLGARALVLAWFIGIATALAVIAKYVNTPSEEGAAPPRWPLASRVTLDSNCPTLVMFAHPHCPCTRASLGELDRLLVRCPNKIRVNILVVRPSSVGEDWVQTDLWRSASAMPGVRVTPDANGVEARRFHSRTSGKVLLYNPQGRLLFQGGITGSRGHSGDNPGVRAIVGLVGKEVAGPVNTPVFGCSLLDDDTNHGSEACRK